MLLSESITPSLNVCKYRVSLTLKLMSYCFIVDLPKSFQEKKVLYIIICVRFLNASMHRDLFKINFNEGVHLVNITSHLLLEIGAYEFCP